MIFKADTFDDALGDITRKLLKNGLRIVAGKGSAREFAGVLIELSNPRARVSRTEGRGAVISFLGETLWYLSGSDRISFIEYYIPKYRSFIRATKRAVRAPGAYGPRLFAGDQESQMTKILTMLKEKKGKSDTRQAVAQIFDQRDLRHGNFDIPRTTTLQFLPRRNKLNVVVTMRSNDVYRGFPGDVFAFTFIQELVARSLGLEVGTYSHFVGSLHLYESDETMARRFLGEGFQSPVSMPAMPESDPAASLSWLLKTEEAFRCGLPEPESSEVEPYWQDLGRLLQIKSLYNRQDLRQLIRVKSQMASPIYDALLRRHQTSLQRKLADQPLLPGIAASPRIAQK